MRGKIVKTVIMTATLLAGISVARAQSNESAPPPPASATEDERRSIFSFQVENDVFNRLSPTDRD